MALAADCDDRTGEELIADDDVRRVLARLGRRRERCPRCWHGLVNPASKHGFCQPCEREHEERIRASRRRSYHRRRGLPTVSDSKGQEGPHGDEVMVGDDGYRLLRVEEAAAVLGVSVRTVKRWVANGRLRSILLSGRARRVPTDAIVEFLDQAEADGQ